MINSIGGMLGLTLDSIVNNNDEEIVMTTIDGRVVRMYHYQDCCETVEIDEIHGDLDDLVGAPLLIAEEVTNSDEPPRSDYAESYTWTFYKMATRKGHVTIRWYGSSNGYYSESVYVEEVMKSG